MEEALLQSLHHCHFPALGRDARRDTRRLFQEYSQGLVLWDLDRALGFHCILPAHAQTQQNVLLGSFPLETWSAATDQAILPHGKREERLLCASSRTVGHGSECQLKTNGRCSWPTLSAIQIRCLPRNSNVWVFFFPAYTHYLLSLQSKREAKIVS